MNELPVLDYGFVKLVDHMGSDTAITGAARMSYQKGTKRTSDDTALLRYLYRKQHTTPFEMVEFKLHLKTPLFIGEQFLRQRTANVNKESGRFSVLCDDMYVPSPDRIARQSTLNKQGSGTGYDDPADVERIALLTKDVHKHARAVYEMFTRNDGLDYTRELARGVLPSNQYVQFMFKLDLHNWFNFLHARLDDHAQWEIRQYAAAIRTLIEPHAPEAFRAFDDYRLHAVTFSRMEREALGRMLKGEPVAREMWPEMSVREWNDFQDKLQALG